MEEQSSVHPSFSGVIRQRAQLKEKLSAIKRKIGIYSAKGGVGKTTMAVNLAFTLARGGKTLGLFDADIDCPNLPMFLGIDGKIDISSAPFQPIIKDGVKIASTAMLVDEATRPMIWRGPMITKMLNEMLIGIEWGELDYLILDLPPGTSDSPLTIMQLLDLHGFIIVTTPQKIAAVNAGRSGLMAKRLGVPLLGIIENMSEGSPSKSTVELTKMLDTELLGTVKRNPLFDLASDLGKVPALTDEKIGAEFESIARKLTH